MARKYVSEVSKRCSEILHSFADGWADTMNARTRVRYRHIRWRPSNRNRVWQLKLNPVGVP
jgi:hypothetical protein